MQLTCHDCQQAQNTTWWGGYRSTCKGCTARAVARSLACFNAIKNDDQADLKEAIGRLFPAIPYEDARALVWEWWQHDHSQQEAVEP